MKEQLDWKKQQKEQIESFSKLITDSEFYKYFTTLKVESVEQPKQKPKQKPELKQIEKLEKECPKIEQEYI